ncbi:MAG: hypothetical protein GY750_09250 [Lentisphaerae bacterium]|nr:hypothetical protein [Lentisphaerota bacterium]
MKQVGGKLWIPVLLPMLGFFIPFFLTSPYFYSCLYKYYPELPVIQFTEFSWKYTVLQIIPACFAYFCFLEVKKIILKRSNVYSMQEDKKTDSINRSVLSA